MLKKIFAIMSIVIACILVPISCSVCSVNADTTISLTAYDDTIPETPVWAPDVDSIPKLTDIGDYSTDIGLLTHYSNYSVHWSSNNVNLNYIQETDGVSLGYFNMIYTSSYIDSTYGNILGLNSVKIKPTTSTSNVYYFETEHSINVAFNTKPSISSSYRNENVLIDSVKFSINAQYIHNFEDVNLIVNYLHNGANNSVVNVLRFENVTYTESGYTTNYVYGNMYVTYNNLYSSNMYGSINYYTPRIVDNSTLQNDYYFLGYFDGAMYGYDVGYGDGYGDGYGLGYEDGFQDGLAVTKDIEEPMLAIVNGANTLLDIQLFGAFSVRDMLGIVLALSFLFIGIHLFRG